MMQCKLFTIEPKIPLYTQNPGAVYCVRRRSDESVSGVTRRLQVVWVGRCLYSGTRNPLLHAVKCIVSLQGEYGKSVPNVRCRLS